jgi:CRP/FNR family transcriptional regulator, cyclic AMP receptor protein
MNAPLRYSDQPSSRDWADVLATLPLFSSVPKRRLHRLARQATFAEFATGELVLARGGRGNSLYVILDGTAKAFGRPNARTLRTGDHFGELALFDGGPRSATVVALGELHVIVLPQPLVLRLARRQPEVSLALLGALSTQLRHLETVAARG